jgi:hypothetical protein
LQLYYLRWFHCAWPVAGFANFPALQSSRIVSLCEKMLTCAGAGKILHLSLFFATKFIESNGPGGHNVLPNFWVTHGRFESWEAGELGSWEAGKLGSL